MEELKFTKKKFKCENCTNNGSCSRCGECCSPFIPITWKEYKRIKKYIEENNIEPSNIRDGNNVYISCPFYDRANKKCNVYSVRPEVCKRFLCSHKQEKINTNRKYFDERAQINGNTYKLMPLDLLFYNRPDTIIYYIYGRYKPKNKEHFIEILNDVDRSDIVKAIELGQIKINFDEESQWQKN